jgi:hypothetical protein
MHPSMPRQLTADHIGELPTEAGDARRAREAPSTRPAAPAACSPEAVHPAVCAGLRVPPRTPDPGRAGCGRPGGELPAVRTSQAAGYGKRECRHRPRCPDALAPGRSAARIVAIHPGQGWSLLCNGVVLFDDGGALLPDGRAVAPAPPAQSVTHHTFAVS